VIQQLIPLIDYVQKERWRNKKSLVGFSYRQTSKTVRKSPVVDATLLAHNIKALRSNNSIEPRLIKQEKKILMKFC
jgi:hypothetical protein